MPDPALFERYAEDVKPDFERRRERSLAKRRANRRVKEAMIEQRELERRAELVSQEKREELLEGPYGREFAALMGELALLTLSSGEDLVRLIQRLHWLIDAPADYRHEALSLVSRAVIRVREGRGMPPFRRRSPLGAAGALHQDQGGARE